MSAWPYTQEQLAGAGHTYNLPLGQRDAHRQLDSGAGDDDS